MEIPNAMFSVSRDGKIDIIHMPWFRLPKLSDMEMNLIYRMCKKHARKKHSRLPTQYRERKFKFRILKIPTLTNVAG